MSINSSFAVMYTMYGKNGVRPWLVLAKQKYHGKYVLSFLGGRTDGQRPIVAAGREVREESCYSIRAEFSEDYKRTAKYAEYFFAQVRSNGHPNTHFKASRSKAKRLNRGRLPGSWRETKAILTVDWVELKNALGASHGKKPVYVTAHTASGTEKLPLRGLVKGTLKSHKVQRFLDGKMQGTWPKVWSKVPSDKTMQRALKQAH